MRVIIDRFEKNFAVCEKEDCKMINIDKSKIPDTAKEGDVLIINDSSITIDLVETELRKKQIEEMSKDLWN